MIKYITGNLLDAHTEALVNTVNTVGVMGKGIALQFKNRFPENYKIYRDACKNESFSVGQVLVVKEGNLLNQKYIINFPTKAHWKADSKYEYISSGLIALKEAILTYGINSIALPPLGCGNGGLEWPIVKSMIEKELKDLQIEILIYEPNFKIREVLQKELTKTTKRLTPARAMLLYMMYAYESVGEQSSLFVANKLAYFLQRSGENLRLKFEAHHYGPYTVQLNHVLLHLNGEYLQGMEQNTIKPFEPLFLNYQRFNDVKEFIESELSFEQKERLNSVISLINRFESTFSLELLATVDFIMQNKNTRNPELVLHEIASWSERKTKLFQLEHIKIAIEHLINYSDRSLAIA